jgi:hypothetical protein
MKYLILAGALALATPAYAQKPDVWPDVWRPEELTAINPCATTDTARGLMSLENIALHKEHPELTIRDWQGISSVAFNSRTRAIVCHVTLVFTDNTRVQGTFTEVPGDGEEFISFVADRR